MLLMKKTAVGTGYIALMNGINLLISFVFYLAIARILTPSEVGSISLLLLVMSVFSTFTSLALNSATTKFVSEYSGKGDPEKASAAFWGSIKLVSIVAFPLFVLTIIASSSLASFISGADAPLISMVLAVGLILNYTSIVGGAFVGLFLYGLFTVQNIIYNALGRLSAIVLAGIGLRIYGVALGILFGASMCLFYSILVLRGKLRRTKNLFSARLLLDYSFPIYIANIIVLAQGWLDIAVLYKITADLPTVGIYYLVVSSTAILALLPNSLISVLFPTMSYKMGESGPEGVKKILEISVRFSLLIIVPLSLALAAVAPTALTIAYGTKYTAGGMALTVAALGVIPLTIYSLLNSALQAVGYTRPVAVAGAVSVLADLVTLLVAVPALSGVGAALARVVMALAAFAVSYVAIRSRLKFNLRGNWKMLVFASLSALPAFIIDRMISLEVLAKGLLELVVFMFAVLLLLKILKPFNQTEKRIIEGVLPRKLRPMAMFILD